MAAAAGHAVTANPEASQEETDQQERNNKKVKRSENNLETTIPMVVPEGPLFPDQPRGKTSYRAMLGGRSADVDMSDGLQEVLKGYLSEESHPEDEDDDDHFFPTVGLTSNDKKRIYRRWQNTLIIKLLGKRVGYRFFTSNLNEPVASEG
ncbi:hypothetical protein Tsubulata_019083 [Turnera subulata]|uniref:Uncharacterized protein n=1 Tax=Turnera subulata TaxID=218843 RepID=A0A9Q0JRV9_9ROSI|nr:hypothetical protein Tsubulata_019083 [Turnera subulata]